MPRKVFYSFHYSSDNWRVSQVRNIGAIEDNKPASDNDWETIKKGGSAAIERWIDNQLIGRSCTVVLIGKNTADRHWVNYEIIKSWNQKKGLLGIYIHNLKDRDQRSTIKGKNPFDSLQFTESRKKLSTVIPTYDPPYTDSKAVYAYIKANIEKWIEDAINLRK